MRRPSEDDREAHVEALEMLERGITRRRRRTHVDSTELRVIRFDEECRYPIDNRSTFSNGRTNEYGRRSAGGIE
jgi:hypothetical protein